MFSTELIEEMNREQLATATDRLLLSGRPRRHPRGSGPTVRELRASRSPVVRTASAPAVKPRTSIAVLASCLVSLCFVMAAMATGVAWPL